MLDRRNGDDELMRTLSAEIKNLKSKKKKAMQIISDVNDAFLNIESRLTLKQQQKSRLKMLSEK